MKKKRMRVKVNKILIVLFFFAFFCAIIKLSYVALSPVVDGTNLAEFVEGRNTTTETLYASRGNIYDINGEVLATVDLVASNSVDKINLFTMTKSVVYKWIDLLR